MAEHRLVAIGDSLTQGFLNGAVDRTDVSFPARVACALGERERFRSPEFGGPGGIPLNLEWIVRRLGERFGNRIGGLELPSAIVLVHRLLAEIESYWERGPGAHPPAGNTFHHNLAVWGYEIADAFDLTSNLCDARIPPPRRHSMAVPEQPLYRTARRVLNPAALPEYGDHSALDVAGRLAREGGLENLVVMLGANHALGAMTRLEIRYSTEQDLRLPPHERRSNLFRPEHFRTLYERMLRDADEVGAERLFLGTVPHVTIPPVTRGVGVHANGYYEYYTRPWIWDTDFDPGRHAALTGEQARHVDAHVDDYNAIIREAAAARADRFVIDVGGMLDSLAFRRHRGHVGFRFPEGMVDALRRSPALAYLVDDDGGVNLDTRFMRTRTFDGVTRLIQGGLFSLDGMHPTITGYGLVAEAVLREMRAAGVETSNELDWDAIVAADTLLNDPPGLLSDLHALLTFLDRRGLLSALLELF